jgi:hypothetical protein
MIFFIYLEERWINLMLIDVEITERFARILTSRFILDHNLTVNNESFERLASAFLKHNGVLTNDQCFKIIKG